MADSRRPSFRRSLSGAGVIHGSVKLAAVGVAIAATHVLTAVEFGIVLAVQAISLVAGVAWDAGIGVRIIRDIASGEARAEVVSTALKAKVRLGAIPVCIVATSPLLFPTRRSDVVLLSALMLCSVLSSGFGTVFGSALQGVHRYGRAAGAMLAGRLITVSAVMLLALAPKSSRLVLVGVAYFLGELATSGLAWRWWRASGGVRAFGAAERPLSFVRRSLPFAANGAFIVLYNKFDVVIVTLAGGALMAGFYGPASRIQDAFGIIPAVLTSAIVPVAAANLRNLPALRKDVRSATMIGLVLSLPTALVLILAAPRAVPLILGQQFAPSVPAVQILAMSLPFVVFSGPRLAALVAADRGGQTARIYAVTFGCAVLAQTALTRLYGLPGAAWGALLREPVLALGAHLAFRKLVAAPTQATAGTPEARTLQTGLAIQVDPH